MARIIDPDAYRSGQALYRALTRREALRLGGLAGLGLLAGAPGRARAAAGPVVVKYGHTSGVHEMAQYVVPDFLPPAYRVEWVDFGIAGIGRLAAMMQGLCDIMSTANSYVISGRAEGAPITGICGIAGRGQAIVAREDRGIRRLEDLKGKRLATKKFTSSHVMLMLVLRAVGIDPNKDVQIVDVGEPAGFNVMIERGEADAGQLWEPNVSIAAARPGIRKLELDRFFQLTWATHSGTFVTQKLIQERPEMIQAVVDATVKATELIRRDRDRWLTISQRYLAQSPEILRAAMDNSDPRVDLDLTMLYRNAEVMLELGIIKRDVTAELEQAVDYRFLERATGKKKEALGYVSYADYKRGKRYLPS
ncbi:MAG: ABC transporter substrate-binding protein [Candidatus Methylomirabilales bacterium]